MERKILLAVLLLIIVLIFSAIAYAVISQRMSSEKYCETDKDCACGVSISTGECFYGNKNFVDTSRQCPDFCSGIAANLAIRCVENRCMQVNTMQ